MSLIIKDDKKPKVSSGRLDLEARLSAMKLQSKKFKDYTVFMIYEYMMIRCYNDRYQLHLWGNIDHYVAFQRPYSTIKYQFVGSAFLMDLMREIK